MHKYIQGPWLRYEYEDRYIITDPVGIKLAEIPIYNNKDFSDFVSKLMTAAPDMYTMIDDMSPIIEELKSHGNETA